MKIRFYNARVLTMRDGEAVFSGEVHTDGSRILYVGPSLQNTQEMSWDREIDCRGNLLMPGFKNAHTHSAMTFLRSHADDLPLQEWLNEQVFPYEAKLNGEDIYTLTQLAILEYLTSGITSIMEMYLAPENIAKACSDAGMRCVQVGGLNNFSQSVEELERWFLTLNGQDPLTSFCLGIHAEYTCSPELLEKAAALSEKYKAPVFAHCSETAREVEECRTRYGCSPVEYLCKIGLWNHGGAGYHLVHTSEADRELLLEKGIGVVTNPASNSKLASGIAPVSDYIRLGIPVAIGTDGPASNNCLDMFREMFLVTALAKLRENDASAVPAYRVLEMAVSDGAKIMQLPDADSLAPGKLADMILIDLQQPNMQPIHDIPRNLVYSGSKSNVIMTMINGKILYDRLSGPANFYIGRTPEEIYEETQAISKRIFGL